MDQRFNAVHSEIVFVPRRGVDRREGRSLFSAEREVAIQGLAPQTDFRPTEAYFAGARQPRGSESLRIAVAGLALRLDHLSSADAGLVRERYGVFVRPDADPGPEAVIGVVEAGVPGFLAFRGMIDGEPEIYRIDQSWRGGRLVVFSYDFAGWFDPAANTGQLALAGREPIEAHRAVENFLRVITAHRILERGGCLIHASAVVRGGAAHLFFGPSGSGKTTVTQLSEGMLSLGDDLSLIRDREGEVETCPVPFRGVYREPPPTDRSFPVAGLYRLIQAPEDRLERLERARGTAEVLGSLPFVMEGGGAEKALGIVSRMADRVPIYHLRFRKSAEFWRLIPAEEGR